MPRLLRDWLEEKFKDKEFLEEYLELELKFQAAQETTRWRLQRGWSQQTLAGNAGLPQAMVSRVENAAHTPTLETIQKLAYALGVRPRIKFEEVREDSEYPWAIVGSIPLSSIQSMVHTAEPWVTTVEDRLGPSILVVT